MHDIQSLTAALEALTLRVAALEMRLDAQQYNATPPAPELATEESLDALARRHTGMNLIELLDQLDLQYPAVVGDVPVPVAHKIIFDTLVETGAPILTRRAVTRVARNGSLYLMVDFGFGGAAVFNTDIDRVFRSTAHLLLDWQRDGFGIDFDPPLAATLERDRKGYPRILALASASLADWDLSATAEEMPF